MEVSAGVLIFRNGSSPAILMGHATGTNRWDIPKGHIEEGEAPIEAACRELKEETGINIIPSYLMDIGRHEYIKGKKDLHLFVYTGFQDFVPAKCVCTSYFERDGEQIPEMDAFAWVHLKNLKKYAGKSLVALINELSIKHKFF
ncbi:nudix hydrolase [Serratia phage PS2]|uniref:Nudix hydrolase n=1 Tax=Serratia phage PS2 TaxID=1481112 RepID=A0A023W5N2_9CAUD|nr:nudix hydrolase [Serratia phage PS2]AHY25373.1 nudix hydrolase [Serratia phage PS2]